MFVKRIGINYIHDTNFVKNWPNGADEYTLLLIKSKALLKINGKTIHAEPDTVIVYRKFVPQFFCADGENFINDWICYDIDAHEEGFLESIGIDFETLYKIDDTIRVSELMQLIHYETVAGSMYMRENIAAYFKLLFYTIAERIHSKSAPGMSGHSVELKKIRNMIYAKPSEKWSVQVLADKMHLSDSYFHHLYKAQFQISPISDVVNSRIQYAKYLLSSTDYSVSAIAAQLNYKSDIQFVQQFKSVTKQTPLQYRKGQKKPSAQ